MTVQLPAHRSTEEDPEEAELVRDIHLSFGELRERVDRLLRTALDPAHPLEARSRAAERLRTVSEVARALEKPRR